MSSAPSAVIAAGFLVLGGSAAGFVLGRWTATAPAAELAVPEAAVHSEALDLAPLLAEIRSGHAEILRALRERPTPSGGTSIREPAIDDAKLDRIAARLDEIAKRTEEIGLQPKGLGLPSLESIQQKYQLFEAGLEPMQKIRTELLDAHARWTQRDLIDRYGQAHSFSWNERTANLTYHVGPATVRFDLTKDQVTDVQLMGKE